MRVDSVFYIRADEELSAGIGYRIKALNTVLTANDKSAELGFYYYDRGSPVFVSVKNNFDSKKVLLKIGTGYPINEKVSLVIHYSTNDLFVGFRRIL